MNSLKLPTYILFTGLIFCFSIFNKIYAQPNLVESCQLLPYDATGHTFWFFDLPGDPAKEYVFNQDGGNLEVYDNGTARINGIIQNVADSNRQWKVSLRLKERTSYGDWVTQGRFLKNGGGASLADRLNWVFYELDNSVSRFSGILGTHYDGDTLSVLHHPADLKFGFQIGIGANDLNGSYGISGWFLYNGSYSGKGDLNANLDCPIPACDFAVDSIYALCINEDSFEMVVSFTGSGANTKIEDSEGNPPLTNLTQGTYTLGPYFNSTDVFITVSKPDVDNCLAFSGPYTADCMTIPFCDVSIDSLVATCISPNTFSASVTISGSGSTYTIYDDQGTPPTSGLSSGTYSFGAYPEGDTVSIFVEDNAIFGCIVSGANVTADCPMDGPENISSGLVYPNPANSRVYVELEVIEEVEEITCSLLDISGRIRSKENIKTIKGGQRIEIETSHLPDGIYLLKLAISGKTISSQRVSIIH